MLPRTSVQGHVNIRNISWINVQVCSTSVAAYQKPEFASIYMIRHTQLAVKGTDVCICLKRFHVYKELGSVPEIYMQDTEDSEDLGRRDCVLHGYEW